MCGIDKINKGNSLETNREMIDEGKNKWQIINDLWQTRGSVTLKQEYYVSMKKKRADVIEFVIMRDKS